MKSILFKPDMIEAIVEGRKTQTADQFELPPVYIGALPDNYKERR